MPSKRKATGTLARSRAWLEADGWRVIKLEWRDRFGKTHDVAGCDLLAVKRGKPIMFVQATDTSHRGLDQIENDPDARAIAVAGCLVVVHCWRYLRRLKCWGAQVHRLVPGDSHDPVRFQIRQLEDIYEQCSGN